MKDQDFLQSFKKLDITQAQADRILSQLEQDVEVLNKNGLIDYSLFMIIVLRPFKQVEHFNPSHLGTSQFEESKVGEGPGFDKAISMMVNYQQLINSTKRLYIGEIDPRLFVKGDQHMQMMLLKETTRNRTKIFHICDPYDIATVRALREQEAADEAAPLLRKKSDKHDHGHDHGVSEEEEGRYSLIKEEANPLQKMAAKSAPAHSLPGSLQVINFQRTNLSYEFASKYIEENKQ
jgi:hypothetical protein